MFDAKYYQDKKQKLIQKAQQIQNEYLQGAFKFTAELNDIQQELNKIGEWEKENPVKEVKDTPKK
jgi:vacuolar-type H+-ATPase subunit D/Vma8